MATACIGDVAVAAGAGTLAESLAFADAAGTIASTVSGISTVVGGAADLRIASQAGCLKSRWRSAECIAIDGQLGLDAAFGVAGKLVNKDTVWNPIVNFVGGVINNAYGSVTGSWHPGGRGQQNSPCPDYAYPPDYSNFA